ncbi:MAG TPA: periplasmic heavy metal sensor [Xanthobacteraceae bacterium]|jgi:uncharacterized membrane protein
MPCLLPNVESAARVRWLLLASLGLNLFFVGAAGSVAFRHANSVPLATVARIAHRVEGRLDRLEASLPANDATVMRSQFNADAVRVAAATADLRLAEANVRNSLRADPFDPNAMRAAMAQSRLARDNFDSLFHDIIATAATKMSAVGRNRLADWPETHSTTPSSTVSQ